jgi:hypothetical protein
VKSGFDELLQGLRSSRSQALADIGVYVDLQDEMKQLALSTGRTTEQITKQEKAAIAARAIVSQLPDALNKLGDGSLSNADKMGAMEKKLEDIAMKSKQAGVGLLFGYMAAMENATKATQDAFPIFKQWGDWVDEHILNVPKMELDVSLKGKPGEPPKGPDPKLQLIGLEAERDRTMKALESGEAMQGEHFDRMLIQYRNYVVEREKTTIDLAKKEKDVEIGKLQSHVQFIDAQIAEEKRWHEATVSLVDTTEGRITAEEKFKTKVIDLLTERAATEEKIATSRFDGNYKIREVELRAEEEKGQRITDSLISQFQMAEELRERNHQSNQEYVQGAIDLARLEYASHDELYGLERVKLQDQLAFKLRLKKEEIERLLILKQNGDQSGAIEGILGRGDQSLTQRQREGLFNQGFAQDALLGEQQRGDLFAGWKRGMQRYVEDTRSGFGMAADMARRTAGMMEQSFQNFFFDAFEGNINNMKDVLSGFLDFTKQIMSQVTSQVIVKGLVNGLTNAGSLFGNSGGGIPVGGFNAADLLKPYAMGGITSGPSLAGEAGPEAIVPLPNGRSIPVEWRGMPYGSPRQMVSTHPSTMSMPVTVHVHDETGSEVQAQTSKGPDGNPQIDVYIKNVVKQGMRNGEFDPLMRQSFGTRRQPGRR